MKKLLLAALFLIASSAQAITNDMMMLRMHMKADVAIEYLKSALEQRGYAIAHTQKCDGGMHSFGYTTDFYRSIFFGKGAEAREISKAHPDFVSYIPLKMTVVAEREETVMSIVNPHVFDRFYSDDPMMLQHFKNWHHDILSIFSDLRATERSRQIR
jgi:uncharacterized protein (DUF302 family)